MNLATWASELTSSLARLRLLVRALGYFRPDAGRIGLAVGLLLVSIGLNLLKPWPLAILVDSVLGDKPYPSWLPGQVRAWAQPVQLTAIIAVSLALHLAYAAVSAGHAYRVIGRPQSFFVDRDGVLRSIQIGAVMDPDFERKFAQIAGGA